MVSSRGDGNEEKLQETVNLFPNRFASEMKRKRKALGITQEQLACVLQEHDIQVTQGYLSLLEAGQRNEPSLRLVLALSQILGISIDSLLVLKEEGLFH